MTRLMFTAMVGACLAVALLITPSVEATGLDVIGDVAEGAVKNLIRPFWPFEHGKCFTLDRFDLTGPRCL